MSSSILIVEDDPDLVKIYSTQLSADGHIISATYTAQEGLEVVKNLKPDLVILDIMLVGEMNGFDFLEKVKSDENLKNTKILILTNLSSEEKVAKEIGAQEYLIKADTTPKQLSEKVRAVLTG